jgi:hypothetical protein
MADIPLKYVLSIVALAALPLVYVAGGPLVAAMTAEKATAAAPVSDEDIKKMAQQLPYDSVAREPKKFAGTMVVFEGRVWKVLEDANGKDVLLQLAVTPGLIWKDNMWVYYQKRVPTEPRILEGDVVRFWGEYTGLKSYKSVLGASITVPRVVTHIVERVDLAQAGRGAGR